MAMVMIETDNNDDDNNSGNKVSSTPCVQMVKVNLVSRGLDET